MYVGVSSAPCYVPPIDPFVSQGLFTIAAINVHFVWDKVVQTPQWPNVECCIHNAGEGTFKHGKRPYAGMNT